MKIVSFLFFISINLIAFSQLGPAVEQTIHSDELSKTITIDVSQNEINQLIDMQKQSKGKNVVFPVGKLISVDIDMMLSAQWSFDEFENRIGKLKIHSSGATGIGAYFSEFFLPIGSKLYAYTPSHKEVIGPFGFVDNPKNEKFSSGSVNGNEIVLEVFIPKGVSLLPKLKIRYLGYERNPSKIKNANRDFGDSKDCQVNVLCEEGDDWKDNKNAVVRIKMVFGGFESWCSGTIMNNTYQDCTPYILTADHCRHLSTGEIAKENEYDNWEFYFNYESTKCRNPSNEGDVTIAKMTGCTRKASSENGGDGDPDFLLLRLNNSIPQFYNPYFAGWDRRNVASENGVMIHHPAGDIKKISTYIRQVESSEWNGNLIKNSHWKLIWSKTKNGFGSSEGGSSGSALWNQDKRVVGQLTGGSSACEEGNGTGPFNPDYFGKLHSSYTMDMSDTTKKLEYWLDNGRNNPQFIDGINWPCSEQALSNGDAIIIEEVITMFPNPADKLVTISSMGKPHFQLVVFDVLGNKMVDLKVNEEKIKLDVSNWPTGIYVVNSIWNNSKVSQKLIVK